jgi:hypothetical protein
MIGRLTACSWAQMTLRTTERQYLPPGKISDDDIFSVAVAYYFLIFRFKRIKKGSVPVD